MATRRRRTKQGDRKQAIGVVRVSTSKQDIGVEAQRAELERWAKREGVRLLAVFEDIGISGARPLNERPGLIAAITALREHGAGLLVAVKRDRFARHRHTIADVERAAWNAGGVLVTTDGTCRGDDSETEEIAAGFQDILAAMELRRIRDRNQGRAQACIARGQTHGGTIPYGMRRKQGGRKGTRGTVVELERAPDEQRVLRRMAKLRKAGKSYRAIAAALASDGATTRRGGQWQPMVIKQMLDRIAP